MKYITAQPDRIKFAWQLMVQLANFRDVGIDLQDVFILVGNDIGYNTKEMQSLRNTGANVFFFSYAKDYRYLSSVRPHLFKQFFTNYPELSKEYFLYLDCDVIFRRLPDYSKLKLDGNWYVSDARNYIDTNYIIGAGGPEVLMDMCSIVGIDPFFVQSRNNEAGGAQYLMTGTSAAFWEKVERDSIELYTKHPHYNTTTHEFEGYNREKYKALGEGSIQIWCADMWSLLWNAWKSGRHTYITDELSFSWAHHDLASYESRVMLHMAGVTENTQKNASAPHFDKRQYAGKVPFNDDFSWVNPNSASTKYIEYFKQFRDGNS